MGHWPDANLHVLPCDSEAAVKFISFTSAKILIAAWEGKGKI